MLCIVKLWKCLCCLQKKGNRQVGISNQCPSCSTLNSFYVTFTSYVSISSHSLSLSIFISFFLFLILSPLFRYFFGCCLLKLVQSVSPVSFTTSVYLKHSLLLLLVTQGGPRGVKRSLSALRGSREGQKFCVRVRD